MTYIVVGKNICIHIIACMLVYVYVFEISLIYIFNVSVINIVRIMNILVIILTPDKRKWT